MIGNFIVCVDLLKQSVMFEIDVNVLILCDSKCANRALALKYLANRFSDLVNIKKTQKNPDKERDHDDAWIYSIKCKCFLSARSHPTWQHNRVGLKSWVTQDISMLTFSIKIVCDLWFVCDFFWSCLFNLADLCFRLVSNEFLAKSLSLSHALALGVIVLI